MYPSVSSDTAYKIIDKEGDRRYELANHLGNVLAVISDRKTGIGNGVNYTSFEAITISATDYFPFGMSMPGRSFTAANTEGYRYSFNGKEDDTEWAKQDFGARIYDKRIGKFLSIDPLTRKYPWYTPYQFAGNSPIRYIDKEGMFELDPAIKKDYPMIYQYLSTQIEKDVMNSTIIKDTYKGLIKGLTDDDIKKQFANNSGAKLQVWDFPGEQSSCGFTHKDESVIEVATALFKYTENILADKTGKYTDDDRQEALTLLNAVVIHEVGHELAKGKEVLEMCPEIGYCLESKIFKIFRKNTDKPQILVGPSSGNDKLREGIIKGVVKDAKVKDSAGKDRAEILPTVPKRPDNDKKETPSKKSKKKH